MSERTCGSDIKSRVDGQIIWLCCVNIHIVKADPNREPEATEKEIKMKQHPTIILGVPKKVVF